MEASQGKPTDMGSRSKEQDQVSVCSGGGQPEIKKAQKPGKGVKSGAPQEEVAECVGENKKQTIRVRLKRPLLSKEAKKTDGSPEHLMCGEKNQHHGPLPGEEKCCTGLSRPESRPSNSRRTKRIQPISSEEKQNILVIPEQDTSSLMPVFEKDEDNVVKSTVSESRVVKCSSNTCHVHSPGLQNPVVRLLICKSMPLHSLNKSPARLKSVFSRKMQNQIFNIGSMVSESDSISTLENIKQNKEVVKNNKRRVPTILKVKFNFRKREPKTNHSEESDIELKTNDLGEKERKPEDHQSSQDCKPSPSLAKLKSSVSQNETIMDKLNNNTIKSAGSDYTDEETKASTYSICSPMGSWRSQPHFGSDEINDHDFDKSAVTVSSSNISEAKERLETCQRVIPFTGKTNRMCSCARTYVSVIPRKRPANVQNTIIFGIEADRSQEIYSEMSLLFESNNGESIQERGQENESEATCKKRRLDLLVTSTSPSKSASSEFTLDESLSSENSSVLEQLLVPSDGNLSLPLASETSTTNLNGKYCNLPEDVKALGVEDKPQQLPREDDTCLTSKSEMEIDHKTVTNPIPFQVPNEETKALLHIDVPVECSIKKELQYKVCSMSTDMEEVTYNVLNADLKSRHNCSDSKDVRSNCCPSEGFSIGDPWKHEEACDRIVTLPPKSTKKCTNNNSLDLLKAYEEDVLVLDVNEDDPELFNFSFEEETSSKHNCKTNTNVTLSNAKKMLSTSKVEKTCVSLPVKRESRINKIEHGPQSSTYVTNDVFDATSHIPDTCNSLPETTEMSSFAEMEESREPKESQDKLQRSPLDGSVDTTNHQRTQQNSPIEIDHASMLNESSSLFCKTLVPPLLPHLKSESWINTNPSLRTHCVLTDFHSSRKDRFPTENWKHKKAFPRIKQTLLPDGYCRPFFNTFVGCQSSHCLFLHIPRDCEENVCMELLHKLINENNPFLLKRAVWIFRNYYSQYPLRCHYSRVIFGALLNALQNLSLWQDLFDLLEVASSAKIFPFIEQFIKIFERLAFSGLQTILSTILGIFCKFVHNGMIVTPMDMDRIMTIMSLSGNAKNHINSLVALKSSLELKTSKENLTYDMDAAICEVEHCKDNSDWMKLGTLYLTVCAGCEDLTNLKNFSGCIAEALKKESISERPEIPYCQFADSIFKNPLFSDIQKTMLGRIGISVMFFYHQKEQWMKGRRVIYKFHELKINYTILKGITRQESVASRCQVVNVAVEIFLKCGNLSSAVQTLKESHWIINTSMWPCKMMDVLHRHNLLCLLVHEALSKNMFSMCFDVLQRLPGFQESQADFNVSQYTVLFNKLLSCCVEYRSIGMSSSVIDFMIDKKIAVDYVNLRGFILTLAHSGLWTKARKYYKCALALGFYPLFEEKTNPKILYIPSFMSEVEMLMTIEKFMVSNASSIQLQGGCNQTLQIVLKRMEEDSAKCRDSYQAATERLFEASRMSTPRLFIKHMTVNNTNEQVYTLDNNSSLKWLNENMKWACLVWYFP
ncbi:protein TOPAZ1 [Anomaloglossus baeobatrachus]|uniref:protein TOPAZ1 n=1 Tax=Anomaloglossus baeobatrachus TaxID=238106 RepID=UPI003F4F86F3